MSAIKTTSILAILLTLVVSVVGCKTVSYQAGRGEGLKGCWSFDEGNGAIAKNAVGANPAIVQPELKWVDGKRGKAVQFNGQNYVVIPHEDFFNAPNFTVSVWTKLEAGLRLSVYYMERRQPMAGRRSRQANRYLGRDDRAGNRDVELPRPA